MDAFGADIIYNDDFIPNVSISKDIHLTSTSLESLNFSDFDCVAIITNHTYFDIKKVVNEAALVVDTRNATKGLKENHIFKI